MAVNTNALNRFRYGLYAPFYDVLGRQLDRGRRRSIELLDIRPGESVLIPGAGTGLDLPHLSPESRVVAGDLSEPMIRRAERRAAALGLRADCRVMDAHQLDLPDESIDVALLHLILAVIPDPEACICEVSRVMKPGGRVGIFDKFLPEGQEPSLLRRAAGVVTNVLFSDINRCLEPLLAAADLKKVHTEASVARGLFTVTVARKPV
ncbi:MAG: methyltransferase domain-containing protein [Rhodothermales bacterium]|nr:methyltransferase domain-containing protein [Rhodothermales bacterium]